MGILNDIYSKITQNEPITAIGKDEIREAEQLLKEYKEGKASLENRIVEDEEFFKLQHWDYINSKSKEKKERKPSTAWMLNSVINKHADIMDNFPEANCLPRERQDEQDAKALSDIIPVILEHNDYERTYSDNAWYYIKHGVSCQGVFWDSSKENGLGDISIKNVDILNLFWEPGVCNIQDSPNLFYVSLVDNNVLARRYPELKENKLGSKAVTVSEYIYDDNVDNTDKTVVVDWYYKKADEAGRTVLHYVKFAADTVLFASENEEAYINGYYEHGKYPFTISTMYPVAGTPYGFGIISVCRDPQLYIDTLDGLMLEYIKKATRPRYFAKKNAGVNTKDFLDWDKPIVEVQGDIDEERLRQITLSPLANQIFELRQMKVDELKETSSNRDFSQGSTSSGVTSGAAIATLQEAGNKTTRDMLKSLYRSYVDVVELSIELIRQFYDEQREFRITGQGGIHEFTSYSNKGIKEQYISDVNGDYYRRPIFDIEVKAQKSNPYSKMSQNETAVNLYKLGVFVPDNAQAALGMLEMMEFDGKEKVKEYIMQGQTLNNVIIQQQRQIQQLIQALGAIRRMPQEEMPNSGVPPQDNPPTFRRTAQDNAYELKKESYAEKLREKAVHGNDSGQSIYQ